MSYVFQFPFSSCFLSIVPCKSHRPLSPTLHQFVLPQLTIEPTCPTHLRCNVRSIFVQRIASKFYRHFFFFFLVSPLFDIRFLTRSISNFTFSFLYFPATLYVRLFFCLLVCSFSFSFLSLYFFSCHSFFFFVKNSFKYFIHF